MNIRRRHVLAYIIVFSLGVLFILSQSYDDFSRNTSVNETNKVLIEKYLSDDDRKMLIDDNIKTDKFIKYIKTANFSLKNYEYYNIIDENTDLDREKIVEYGNRLANYDFTLGSISKILSENIYTVEQLVSLASIKSPYYQDASIEFYPNENLALSNYNNYIKDYAPKELVDINTKYTLDNKKIQLDKKAATQLSLMCDAMELLNDKVCGGLLVQYGYISYDDLSNNEKKYPSFIKPGHNDFQLGKTITFGVGSGIKSDPMYLWLLDNSYKFGFIQRYPSDKISITHVSNQPAVFRYVGIKQAESMQKAKQTIEDVRKSE
ncbi:hypothetical protein [Mycoplasma sp. P36-A1]|uniref:hypothetical protein n=1 Tax=Mycoplasma sp. P36-A1 TaxID=3252900 RepID=UPI003C306CF2